jgi:hypothetical protein
MPPIGTGPLELTAIHGTCDEVKRFVKRLSKTVCRFQAQPVRVLEQGEDVFVLVRMYGRFKRRACRRDNSRDNKRIVQCVQMVSALGQNPCKLTLWTF